MKRVSLLFLVLFLMSSLSSGAIAMDLMSKGVKAGMTYANIAGDDVGDTGNKLGFGGGAYLDFSLPIGIGFQPELLYTMKGTKSDAETGESTFSVDYVEVPLLATYKLASAIPWTPELQAGPYMGFNARANMSSEAAGSDGDVDIKDETKAVDYGLVIGAGIELNRISIDARYSMGLTSTNDPEEGDALDMKNRSLSLLLGLSF